MAFMGLFIFMSGLLTILGAVLIFVLLWVVLLVFAGLIEGIVLARAGKRLRHNQAVLAQRPRFALVTRILGLLTGLTCGASLLSMVSVVVIPIISRSSETTTPRADGPQPLTLVVWGLFLLSFLLFLLTGIRLLMVARLNRKIQPSPLHRGIAILYRVLGILALFLTGSTVLTVVLLALLAPQPAG